jgi:hypothetical protein
MVSCPRSFDALRVRRNFLRALRVFVVQTFVYQRAAAVPAWGRCSIPPRRPDQCVAAYRGRG